MATSMKWWWPLTLVILTVFAFFTVQDQLLDLVSHYGSNLSASNSVLKAEQVRDRAPTTTPFTKPQPPLELLPRASTAASTDTTYTCSASSPCSNGACCGESGWCGFGPTYCGTGCQSNCNATAQCGQYAPTVGQTCPLNVCCSEYGFCGTTSEFCGKGCQSNCAQPAPKGSPSDSQSRIIGYWEVWNGQSACGTMPIGSIPASLLTHLNVAFAYITSDFDLTTMPGISPTLYQNVGNVKSKNPNIKIIISVGGWTFTNPGASQEIFSNMASSETNRATFISNIIAWLGEYGYDGIDFDWEYPGATDRGGHADDGANYVQFLKELRAAITASGKDYIVTFTAPSSYWYLQYFDLPGMIESADWINFMSYDLHGVWDASDIYIGLEVFAHTNLTEIELALDLFWRVDIDPSDIVLGLGFYGRTYTLADPTCWQPGCAFKSAGSPGPCTATAGILSYREIMQVIADTGATPYTDKTAGVEYMVYEGNQWLSYDSATTFAAKIKYANELGISGLMIWAIDLDDGNLDALTAVVGTTYQNVTAADFSLVPLDYLFPSGYVPSNSTTINYGLINIGSAAEAGETNPSNTGFGFMLVAGDSHAVSSLAKRDGEREPFVFIDCPKRSSAETEETRYTARVVCMNDDLQGCFQLAERGVKGTLVQMPEDCFADSIARAISLEVAKDQYVPREMTTDRSPTSPVYDFTFDMNIKLARRDTNNTMVRIDFSNVIGYWDNLVDYPGIQSSDASKMMRRYFAPTFDNWQDQTAQANGYSDSTSVKQSLDSAVFFSTTGVGQCDVYGEDYTEGIGATVEGTVDSQFYYGFTFIGTMEDLSLSALQSHGFIRVTGGTDMTFTVGGIGDVDVSESGLGNPAMTEGSRNDVGGATVPVGGTGMYVGVTPYFVKQYQMTTQNGTGDWDDQLLNGVSFDGLLQTRVVTDFGKFTVNYPSDLSTSTVNEFGADRSKNSFSIPGTNVMYSSSDKGGLIEMGTYLTFGVEISVGYLNSRNSPLPVVDYNLTWSTSTYFTIQPSSGQTCVNYEIGSAAFASQSDDNKVGWTSSFNLINLVDDLQEPTNNNICYSTAPNQKRSYLRNETSLVSRASSGGFLGIEGIDQVIKATDFLPGSAANIINTADFIAIACKAGACLSCFGQTSEEGNRCCGCTCLECKYGFSDIPPCPLCDDLSVDGYWPNGQQSPPGLFSDDQLFTKRAAVDIAGEKEVEAAAAGDGQVDSDSETSNTDLEVRGPENEQTSYHSLSKRVNGEATMSPKYVTFCSEQYTTVRAYYYPAFPKDASWQWENIQGGRWDSIARYYGNASADCTDWNILRKVTEDTITPPGGTPIRCDYQTEHVFEGQLIGIFFTEWLVKGQVPNQAPSVTTRALYTRTCDWVSDYIEGNGHLSVYWFYPNGEQGPFSEILLAQLGNQVHLDRLAILQARPNRMKGSMFSGNRAIDPKTEYKFMTPEEQLLAVRDFGLVFSYMNNADVFESFCSTYNAIYGLLLSFDHWYETQAIPNGAPAGSSTLSNEWITYVPAFLKSIAANSKALFFTLYNERTADPYWDNIWESPAMLDNSLKFEFTGKCNNLIL